MSDSMDTSDLVARLRACAVRDEEALPYEAADRIAALEADNTALRELMNVYNLGGWTDAERLMRERNESRAEVAALREFVQWADALRFHMDRGRDREFYRDKYDAARAKVAG